MINKFCEAKVLLQELEHYREYFTAARSVLEIGGGQGWASCLVKRCFPDKRVVVSDISRYAIASCQKWEYIFQVSLDDKFHCKSYEIPLDDESVDLVFCFQAAHHFVRHRKTLQEVRRVLSKGGVCLYLFEPVCRQYLYRASHARVNRKRPEVPEDVLVYKKISEIASQIGLDTSIRFNPTLTNRGPAEFVYYLLLQKIAALRQYLPCTADFVFTKK
ncbi:MAG: class I SAM-dependent methyltransferase [Gemmatimonadaceae bacterium]|nr:class I SAM-dependent methyltransferase [Gloeobacterales cyanobacterium ES-bin-141]